MDIDLKIVTEGKLKKYHEENLAAQKGKIVFVGSSLMEMFPIEKFMEEMGNPYTIYNRGVGGYKTEDLMEALDVCVFELEPSRIFINIGTNDLSDADILISEMIENYHTILNRIMDRLPNVELYLMAYYPVNYDAATDAMKPCLKIRNNEKIALANEEVRKLAEYVHGRYIDVTEKLKDGQGNLKAEYTIEGMHIKEEGYRVILSDVLKYVGEPVWI